MQRSEPPPAAPSLHLLTVTHCRPQTTSARVPGSVIPPPLVRGGQQVASKLGVQASSQVVMPPLVRGAQVRRVQRLWSAGASVTRAPSLTHLPHPQQIHSIRQHSGSGPPPLLLAPRAAVPSVQIQGQRIIQQGLIRVASVPSTSLLVNIPQVRPPHTPLACEPRWMKQVGASGLSAERVGT